MVMKLIKDLLQKFKNYLLFIFPIIYIAYILYLRVIMVRPEREIFVPLSSPQIFLTVVIILFLLIQLYFLLKKVGIISETKQKSFIILWCIKQFTGLYQKFVDIWLDFYRYFVVKSKHAIKIHMLLKKFGEYLGRHETVEFMLTTIILFQVIPRIIVITAFLVDIFILQEFSYFYKALGLLLFPLLYSVLRSMLAQFFDDNYAYFKEAIKMDFVPVEDSGSFRMVYSFAEGFELPSFVKNIDDLVEDHLLPIIAIERTISYYDATMQYYKIYFLFILITLMYIIGWSTILIYGITL